MRLIEIIDKKIERYSKLTWLCILLTYIWIIPPITITILLLNNLLIREIISTFLYLLGYIPLLFLKSYYKKKEKSYREQKRGIPYKFQGNIHERRIRKLFKKGYRKHRREYHGIKCSLFHKKCSECQGLGALNPLGTEGWSFCKLCDGTGLKLKNITKGAES